MGSYKSYKGIIKQAELTAMSPDAVAAFLSKRARQSEGEWLNDKVDDDTETALLTRGDPLINLALAKHGRFFATLKPLFAAGEPSAAIRLSVLSSNVVSGGFFSTFPAALFDDKEQAAAWLIAAPSEELLALFENHNLDYRFLRDLLECKKPWDQIPDDRLATFVVMLYRNKLMHKPYGDGFMFYEEMCNAAWTLAERVEPTERWAVALNYLYDFLETNAFSIKTPLELAARWHIDPSDADAIAEEAKKVALGKLSSHQCVRKGLARLALHKDSKLLPSLLASDDLAFRSAAYAYGDINPRQLSAFYERDGQLVYFQAHHNRKIYPDSFKDEDGFQPELEVSDEPATKADVLALSEMLAQPGAAQGMEQLKKSLGALNSRIGWVWWFSLGALATSLWRH